MFTIRCSQNHIFSALLPDVLLTGNKAIKEALSQAQKELLHISFTVLIVMTMKSPAQQSSHG